MISIDSETTGVDLYHGARSFFWTIGREDGTVTHFEWDVNPLTREPVVIEEDVIEIQTEINHNELALQNPRFDVTAWALIGDKEWPWNNTYCTLIAGHLLGSNHAHDLTTMALRYLNVNIQPFEDKIKKATNEARKLIQAKKNHNLFGDWKIAKQGVEGMPSAKSESKAKDANGIPGTSPWKFDMWTPRAVAKYYTERGSKDYPLVFQSDGDIDRRKSHYFWYSLRDYGNADSSVTLPLLKEQIKLLKERALYEIYLKRLELLPIIYKMEQRGLPYKQSRLRELEVTYQSEAKKHAAICLNIADSYNAQLTLPKSGVNNSLKGFLFETLKLPVLKKTKKGKEGLDEKTLQLYVDTLPTRGKPNFFIQSLMKSRKYAKKVEAIDGYKRFALDVGNGHYLLHPSLNPTGTNTLRFSSHNPNSQNVSKRPDDTGRNLRHMFGPLPGREWWSCDAKNIELRLPAYEAGEQAMIDLFEKPDEAPYFGSYHLLVFDILHPKEFALHGAECKNIYEATLYQWIKNGNFAVQYGAQEYSGTADRAYHVDGAQSLIQGRFTNIAKLSVSMIAHAERYGFVYTMPDRTTNSKHGYPLECTRTRWGGIKPTVPLSYHIQGTAMWVMCRMMIEAQKYIDAYNEGRPGSEWIYSIAQIHDEILFDFPFKANQGNLKIARDLQRIMSKIGDDLVSGIPLPTSLKYHAETWAGGVAV